MNKATLLMIVGIMLTGCAGPKPTETQCLAQCTTDAKTPSDLDECAAKCSGATQRSHSTLPSDKNDVTDRNSTASKHRP